MIEQGSQEWFQQRLGKVTSSRVKDVMAKGRGGAPSASRKNYMMQLLCERLTGVREETFTSAAMTRGTEIEPIARSAYEIENGVMVAEVGFVLHPEYNCTGSSPDGLVGDSGLIEIKNPNTAQHVACIQSGVYDDKYWWQMQHQMACTDRQWCDFASFDNRMPDSLQLFVARVARDEQAISEMMDEILEFVGQLETIEQSMRQKMELAA